MQLVTRAKMAKELGVSVNTFDKHYRYKKGFPTIMQGSREKYDLDKVQRWLDVNSLNYGGIR